MVNYIAYTYPEQERYNSDPKLFLNTNMSSK